MTKTEATAEVFWTAFRSLSPRERQAVIERMLEDRDLRRDLQDLSLIDRRRSESARPFRAYLEGSR
jgi:hypothetical protein